MINVILITTNLHKMTTFMSRLGLKCKKMAVTKLICLLFRRAVGIV